MPLATFPWISPADAPRVGFTSGVAFRTEVTTARSGVEKRRIVWPYPRHTLGSLDWSRTENAATKANALYAFFCDRKGKALPFVVFDFDAVRSYVDARVGIATAGQTVFNLPSRNATAVTVKVNGLVRLGTFAALAGANARDQHTFDAPGAPTLSQPNAGSKPAGTWNVKCCWVGAAGDGILGTVSSNITVAGATAITTARPASPPAWATGWKVFSSKLGPTATWWETSATIPIATATYDDNTSDAALTVQRLPLTAGDVLTMDFTGQRAFAVRFDTDELAIQNFGNLRYGGLTVPVIEVVGEE